MLSTEQSVLGWTSLSSVEEKKSRRKNTLRNGWVVKLRMSTAAIAESKLLLTPFIIPITTIILLIYAIHLWQTNNRGYKLALELPGPQPIPILGNAHLFFPFGKADMFQKALQLARNFDSHGAVRAFVGHKPLVFLTHPDDAEIILNSSVHLEKSDEYRYFKPWLGNGLLISYGETWRNHRKLIAPAFHMNVLKTFVPLFYKNSLRVVDKLRTDVGMNKEFDCHDYMSEVTVDILIREFFLVQLTKAEI